MQIMSKIFEKYDVFKLYSLEIKEQPSKNDVLSTFLDNFEHSPLARPLALFHKRHSLQHSFIVKTFSITRTARHIQLKAKISQANYLYFSPVFSQIYTCIFPSYGNSLCLYVYIYNI